MVRILWFNVLRDPANAVRKKLMSEYVFSELKDVSNVVYGNNRFSESLPPSISIERFKAYNIPRLHRFNLRTTWHLLTREYDLVVTAMLGAFPTLCTFLIARCLRGKPYVVMAENWYRRRNMIVNWWYRQIVSKAQLVVSQSTKGYRFITEDLKVPEARVVKCVNTLVDLTRLEYNEHLVKELRHDGSIKILCVGRFVEFKGQDILIRAFKQLDIENVKLIFVGNYRTRFGARCRELAGGHPRIVFQGNVPFRDVLAHYSACDVFVMANKFTDDPVEGAESFGYAPMEAAQFGLPLVLTTATGCADDVIIEGKTGFQIPAGDAGALQEKLEIFLRNPSMIREMGENLQAHVRHLNNEDSIVNFKQAFEKLLSRLREEDSVYAPKRA